MCCTVSRGGLAARVRQKGHSDIVTPVCALPQGSAPDARSYAKLRVSDGHGASCIVRNARSRSMCCGVWTAVRIAVADAAICVGPVMSRRIWLCVMCEIGRKVPCSERQ